MIYWDYNSSTPLRREVASELAKSLAEAMPGNASSVHRSGRHWRGRLEAARAKVARVLGCEPREVCFSMKFPARDHTTVADMHNGQNTSRR